MNDTNSNRWIMVTERVPEKDGFYLVTVDGSICGQDEPITTISEFSNGKWLEGQDEDPVIAWMPFPEPCKDYLKE